MPDAIRLALVLSGGAPGAAELRAAADAAGVPCPDSLEAARAPGAAVILVTDDAALAETAAEERGIVPVLICGEGPFARAAVACVASAADAAPLLEAGSDCALLVPFVEEQKTVAARQTARGAELEQAIRAAGGLYVAGTGAVGVQALAAARRIDLPVQGFIDNNPDRQGTVQHGLPVKAPSDLDPRTDVVAPAAGRHAFAQQTQLQDMGFGNVASLSELFFLTEAPETPEKDYLDDLWPNRGRYLGLFLALGDAESRRVMEAVVSHRLSLSIAPLAGAMDAETPQWFDRAFMPVRADQVFVDGGAFDGDTVAGFLQAHGAPYAAIHAFEPDPEIAARARTNLAGADNVAVHAMGLGSGPQTLRFASTGVTDGRLVEEGGTEIRIDSVDRVVEGPVTFLKLDVEGAEAEAIEGAKAHIRNDHPLVAMAVYHKAPDIWALPAQLQALGRPYDLFMRHYTQVAFETVIYAVPRG